MSFAIRTAIILVFVVLLVIFTACNQDPQRISFLTYSWNCSVGIVALVVGSASFCVGSLCLWLAEIKQRGRARRAEQELKKLKAKVTASPAFPAPVRDVPPKEGFFHREREKIQAHEKKEPKPIVTPPPQDKKQDKSL